MKNICCIRFPESPELPRRFLSQLSRTFVQVDKWETDKCFAPVAYFFFLSQSYDLLHGTLFKIRATSTAQPSIVHCLVSPVEDDSSEELVFIFRAEHTASDVQVQHLMQKQSSTSIILNRRNAYCQLVWENPSDDCRKSSGSFHGWLDLGLILS